MTRRAIVTLAALFAAAFSGWQPLRAQERLTVFAAASMKNALDDVNAAFATASGIPAIASYAATSALVKQIEQGAPADIFLAADRDWMAYAIDRRLVVEATCLKLLGNQLVLIAPKGSPRQQVAIAQGIDLAGMAGQGRIAVGDVRAVPAGKYAKAALQRLGAWEAVQSKLAMAENVRAALALVARGEAPLGIVYATDAAIDPDVKIVGHFPAESHPAIVYPVAATRGAKPQAERYLAFLRTPRAASIFARYGFRVLLEPVS